MAVKPISPDDIADAKIGAFPDFVFAAVNQLIAEKYTAGYAMIKQDAIIELILKGEPMHGGVPVTREQIFTHGWLNFEEVYRAQGWEVEYDKPAYYESYDANFTFRKKR